LIIYICNLLPNNNELKAVEDRRDLEHIQLNAAVPKLMEDFRDKESVLTKLNGESEERSTLANAQEIKLIALKTQVEALRQTLDGAVAELKTIEDYRTDRAYRA
jgi:predicted  nucleic acid-binding Zn-ribbon protein